MIGRKLNDGIPEVQNDARSKETRGMKHDFIKELEALTGLVSDIP